MDPDPHGSGSRKKKEKRKTEKCEEDVDNCNFIKIFKEIWTSSMSNFFDFFNFKELFISFF